MRRGRHWWAFVILAVPCFAAHPCQPCHPAEVAAYSGSGMAQSFRRPGKEPDGSFTSPSGTRFTVHQATDGLRQRSERAGAVAEYRIDYIIGSGRHAAGYLLQFGEHLFQSPICYYTNRKSYDLAPGYERIPDPDFTRTVGEQCIGCHASPGNLAISCERCHGPAGEHLRRPVPGSIVNPARLASAARDSVCEQCHLAGVARIANPGKSVADFQPGQRLEEVFTVFTRPERGDFRVISHAEQLAQSLCVKGSGGKLWCGTCHNPHPPSPANAAIYSARCKECHSTTLAAPHPAASECISCHMARREARDGAHTVFTDHRIVRAPRADGPTSPTEELVAWRPPDRGLLDRNLALAYIESGVQNRSPAQMVRGYRMLTEVERSSPNDVAVLRGLGRALLLGKQPVVALRAFERVVALTPGNPASLEDAGVAALEAGRLDQSVAYLEQALAANPFAVSAATTLQQAYRSQGHVDKAEALAARVRRQMTVSVTSSRDLPVH